MVSEYALGNYGTVLSLMFLSWAISSWGLAYALRSALTTRSGRIVFWLLVISGIGEATASVFNITYDVEHNLASLFGFVFPIGALLIGRSLSRREEWSFTKKKIRVFAHIPWIVAVIYIVSIVIMTIQALQYYHGQLPKQAPTSLPPGIIGFSGWTDRLYVVGSCLWNTVVSWYAMRVQQMGKTSRSTGQSNGVAESHDHICWRHLLASVEVVKLCFLFQV